MSAAPERSLISTDMLSFGRQDIESLSMAIPKEYNPKRLEVIGTGPLGRLTKFITDAERCGYEIGAVHGPTGVSENGTVSQKMVLRGIHSFMVDTNTLLGRYPCTEILIHTPEAARAGLVETFLASGRTAPLLIENHDSGVQEMDRVDAAIARLRDMNVPAEPVFDGVHFLRPDDPGDTRPFPLRYSGMIRYLEARSATAPIRRHHFSIGRRDDSYPLELMDRTMLADYGAIIQGTKARTTIEHQPEGIGLLYVTDDQLKATRERNQRLYSVLIQSGIMRV